MNTKLQIQKQGFLCSCVVCLRLITEMHCILQKAGREYFEDFYYKEMFEEIAKFTLILVLHSVLRYSILSSMVCIALCILKHFLEGFGRDVLGVKST